MLSDQYYKHNLNEFLGTVPEPGSPRTGQQSPNRAVPEPEFLGTVPEPVIKKTVPDWI